VVDLFSEERLNHHATVTSGVLAEECGLQLSTFFAGRRRAARAASSDRAASGEGAHDDAR
jgi:tRNA(adenine34) deaminase